MTQEQALKLRDTLEMFFQMNEGEYYHVAAKPAYPYYESDEWAIYLYGNHENSSFLIPLATLAKGLCDCCFEIRASVDRYNAGTTDHDWRNAIRIV